MDFLSTLRGGSLLPPEEVERDFIAVIEAHTARPEALLIWLDHKDDRNPVLGFVYPENLLTERLPPGAIALAPDALQLSQQRARRNVPNLNSQCASKRPVQRQPDDKADCGHHTEKQSQRCSSPRQIRLSIL